MKGMKKGESATREKTENSVRLKQPRTNLESLDLEHLHQFSSRENNLNRKIHVLEEEIIGGKGEVGRRGASSRE